ncbi:MAG: hypothetical protein PVH12_00630, partial [Candidatus Bathyarchaeota archaeon]
MKDSIARLGASLLKDKSQVKFRNERKKFCQFVETILDKFPQAVLDDGTLDEPYRSFTFLTTIGQRPITSLLILQILLENRGGLNGKEIGKKLAKKLEISPMLTTKGGNYKDRVGDLISTFKKIGILESTSSKKKGHFRGEGFRIKKSVIPEVEAFLDCTMSERNILSGFKSLSFKDLFEARFDKRLGDVTKSGKGKREPFKIGKIMKSLLDPKLGISFEDAITVIEEVEPQLTKGMKTTEIQSMLYAALKKHDKKAAENYRLSYPEITSIAMSDGRTETVNYKLVTNLIDKEVKLKLTRNLLDRFASTVYNVISRNPKNYTNETAIREYIFALVRSECTYIRSVDRFIREHIESAQSALEGCQNSLESDEVPPATVLLGQFLEQISLVAIVQFGYLPFKDFDENIDLISNLLRQEEIKRELMDEYQLGEQEIFQFQRIRFLAQGKNNVSRKTLEKMVGEGKTLVELCEQILRVSSLHVAPRPVIAGLETATTKRVLTGYIDLDKLLLGGIPEKYAILLTSSSCDEKDLLIENFLKAGISEGQITLYVTIDVKETANLAEKFPSIFYLFLCNPEADAIIRSLPNVFKLKGVENLNDLDIVLTSFFRRLDKKSKEPRRACIEVVSDALLQHHAVTTRRW